MQTTMVFSAMSNPPSSATGTPVRGTLKLRGTRVVNRGTSRGKAKAPRGASLLSLLEKKPEGWFEVSPPLGQDSRVSPSIQADMGSVGPGCPLAHLLLPRHNVRRVLARRRLVAELRRLDVRRHRDRCPLGSDVTLKSFSRTPKAFLQLQVDTQCKYLPAVEEKSELPKASAGTASSSPGHDVDALEIKPFPQDPTMNKTAHVQSTVDNSKDHVPHPVCHLLTKLFLIQPLPKASSGFAPTMLLEKMYAKVPVCRRRKVQLVVALTSVGDKDSAYASASGRSE